jgi:hypothetical protein
MMEYLAFARVEDLQAYVNSTDGLPSTQLHLSGYVPAVLDGHFRLARRRFGKGDKSKITDCVGA